MPNIVIVIPTFNPTQLLIETLNDLNSYPEIRSLAKVIVNDGSSENNHLVESLRQHDNISILQHSENQGKGAAIKTAIRYVLTNVKDSEYILTVDSDGQHRGRDVLSVIASIRKNGVGVHIGSRGLGRDATPLRSFLGNLWSRKIFKMVYQYELQDTQSGLRAYPLAAFELLLSLDSCRYEFEMEAIITLIKKKIKIFETPIATVYLNKNRSSHFRPLKDSTRVIWVMLKARIKK